MEAKRIKKEYYPSGMTKRAMTFIDDVQEGPTVEYYESGAVKKKMEYVGGRVEGVAREFYKSGELWFEEIYNRGELDGLVKSFYRNGTLQSELPYTKGKLNGVCRVYYGSGVLKKEGYFVNGGQDGQAKIYNEDGSLKRKGDFFDEDDVRDEIVYEKGTKVDRVSSKKLFVQFLILMAFIGVVAYLFDPEGGFFADEEAKEQVVRDLRGAGGPGRDSMLPPANPRDGIIQTYYPTGELYAEWSFLDGRQHGTTRKYFKNGQLQSEISYRQGVLEGESVIYSETGRVISRQLYRDGAIVTDRERVRQETERQGRKIMVPQRTPGFDDDEDVWGEESREI